MLAVLSIRDLPPLPYMFLSPVCQILLVISVGKSCLLGTTQICHATPETLNNEGQLHVSIEWVGWFVTFADELMASPYEVHWASAPLARLPAQGRCIRFNPEMFIKGVKNVRQ